MFRKGFTLIELLIVISILAILAFIIFGPHRRPHQHRYYRPYGAIIHFDQRA